MKGQVHGSMQGTNSRSLVQARPIPLRYSYVQAAMVRR